MATTIDQLQIEISSSSDESSKGLDKLINTLGKLQSATKNLGLKNVSKNITSLSNATKNLDSAKILSFTAAMEQLSKLGKIDLKIPKSVSSQITSLGNATNSLNGNSIGNLFTLSTALSKLSTIGVVDLKISSSLPNQITKIATASNALTSSGIKKLYSLGTTLNFFSKVTIPNIPSSFGSQILKIGTSLSALNPSDFVKLEQLANAIRPLSNLGKSGLTSFINQLNKIPDVARNLAAVDMDAFAGEITRLTNVMRPLAIEMDRVSRGFSIFPTRIQALIRNNERLTQSNGNLNSSLGFLGSGIKSLTVKFGILFAATQRVANVIAEWVIESNAYVENLNLFTVAMGEYAGQALAYAEQVQSTMGIDMSGWIRNQGVFMQMATGFGVATDQAALMSKNLTQLGFDISSFYNISVADAMTKLQSGIAGEIEPLRRLGYSIEVASLEALALEMGITKSVNAMTQGEKSQLRFIAIMEQSSNVMGDMSRSIHTPANAMRILGQQVTQLTRALGNMLIPMLMSILPYVQAFVIVLTEAAQAIAHLFGFELPTIDYSGMDNVTAGAENATDAINGATAATKALKNATLGIDELNIISPEMPSGGGGETSGGIGGGDLGLTLPEYDFLGDIVKNANDLVDSLKKNLLEIEEMITPFIPLLKGVGSAFLIAFGFKWLAKSLATFKGISAITGMILAVKKAVIVSTLVFTLSSNPILALGAAVTSLWKSFSVFMKGLPLIAKIGITIAGLVAIFVTAKSVFYELEMGTKTFWEAMWNLIPVAGAVGVAMYAMLGPWGLVAAAIVGITGAFIGLNKAHADMRSELVAESFYDGLGTSIQEVGAQYTNFFNEITQGNQKILDSAQIVEESRVSIKSVSDEISFLVGGVNAGVMSIEETLPQIKIAFDTLYTETSSVLSNIGTNIISALAGSMGEAFAAAGIYLPDFATLINETTGNMQTSLDSLNTELTEVFKILETDPNNQAALDKMSEILIAMESLAIDGSAEIDSFKYALSDSLRDIDFGKPGNLESVTAGISESMKLAKESVNDATGTMTSDLKFLQSQYGEGTSEFKLFGDTIAINEDSRIASLNAIDAEYQNFLDEVMGNLVANQATIAENAINDWDSLSWWSKLYYGTEGTYVKQLLKTYKDDMAEPFLEGLIATTESSGMGGDIWANAVMDDFTSSLISRTRTDGLQVASTVKESIESAFQNTEHTDIGKYVIEGLTKGIVDNSHLTTDAIKKVATDVITQTENDFDTHSPSVVYEEFGRNIILGLEWGINTNMKIAIRAIEKVANSMILKFKTVLKMTPKSEVFMQQGELLIDGLMEGIQNKTEPLMTIFDTLATDIGEKLESIMDSVESSISDITRGIGKIGSSIHVGVDDHSSRNIKGYMDGGFPTSGDYFMANENGKPEYVGSMGGRTAVANTDQIVTGIARGVAQANSEQNALLMEQNALLRALLDKDTSVQIGDRDIANASNRGNHAKGIPMMGNPAFA